MIHLSARLAWNDAGWNGSVCNFPHLNASCIANETIREDRDDDLEREFSGTHISKLPGWFPPCLRDSLPVLKEGAYFYS